MSKTINLLWSLFTPRGYISTQNFPCKYATSSPNLVANPEAEITAWQFNKWLCWSCVCVCVCVFVLWSRCTWGFSSKKDRKAGSEVVIHHGYWPSFLNCNFPSFSSAERSLSLPCTDSRPLIMNRIHTNCIRYFVSPSLGSTSFWLCLCSVLLYHSRCGQRWACFHV